MFQIALWDLAIERDTEAAAEDSKLEDLPPQLLFIHQENNVLKSTAVGWLCSNSEKPSVTFFLRKKEMKGL